MYAQETTPETMPGSLQDMDPDMAVSWGAAGLQTDELGPSPSRQVDGASVAGSLWEDGSGGGRDAVVQLAGGDGHACACGAIGTLLSVEGGMRDSSNLPLTVNSSEGLPPARYKT